MSTEIVSFERALADHQAGRLEQAAHAYRELIAINTHHADAHHLLGVVCLQNGDYREAIAHIKAAITIQGESPEYHNNLAAAFRANGDLNMAEATYRNAIALNSNYADAHNNLGNVLQELKRNDEAIACYQQAIRLNPQMDMAKHALAELSKATFVETEPTIGESQFSNANVTQPTIELAQRKILHVGCGPAHPENLHERFRNGEWKEIRLDIDPNVQPDIVASLTDMSPVESNSVDAVWSSHNLEHLYAHEIPIALSEFHRVLKPGGTALVTMPDLQQIAEYIVNDQLEETAYVSPAGPIAPLDCLYGLRSSIATGNEFMSHKTGFTRKTLANHLENAGFKQVCLWQTPFAVWAESHKPAA